MKKIGFFIAFLVFFVAVFYVLLQPKTYILSVQNNSQVDVDSVRLFGSAVEGDHLIFSLSPGQEKSLSVVLKAQGSLKYEVHQGLTRVDSLIVQDVAQLNALHQQLTIEVENRFLISDLAE